MTDRNTRFVSFVEAVQNWAGKQRNKLAWAQLDDKGEVDRSVTYGSLLRQAAAIAEHLKRSEHVQEGDRLLLIFPPSLDFIIAFVACLLGGFIAVPAFPPDPTKKGKDLHILSSIATSSGAKLALTSTLYFNIMKLAEVKSYVLGGGSVKGKGESHSATWPDLQWIKTDSIVSSSEENNATGISEIVVACPKAEDIAFLQYTSGSTSEPKGVMISHGNLIHNLNLIISGLSAIDDTVVVSWLPQYHDMGLIGSYLGAIFCGGSGYYLTPFSFVRNPSLWMTCIDKYRGTHMQAPNFAYPLTARKFLTKLQNSNSVEQEKLESMDLSCVRHMINAAEPVEATAIELFYAVFGKYGLSKNVIFPTYGLAEHSVYVCSNGKQVISIDKQEMETNKSIVLVDTTTSSRSNKGSKESKGSNSNGTHNRLGEDNVSTGTVTLVGCGFPGESANTELVIVDPESCTALGENKVGEIWINSPSKAMGYWGLTEKSESDFNAKLKPSDTETENVSKSGFLRTGDLGFLHNGELFICGRIKDLLIIRGRNHYPQDIERTCEALRIDGNRLALRGGCSAAFGVSVAGTECVVLVGELTDLSKGCSTEEEESFIAHLVSAVAANHGVQLSAVTLCQPRSVTKTSSGKIARQWVRKAYLQSTLSIQIEWSNMDSMEQSTGRSGLSFAEKGMRNDTHVDALDPVGQDEKLVREKLIFVLKECLGGTTTTTSSSSSSSSTDIKEEEEDVCVNGHKLTADTRIMSLGLDSMSLIKMQGLMDVHFTVALPDEVLAEEEATIGTLTTSLINGGSFKHRATMVNGWEVVQELRRRTPNRAWYQVGAGLPQKGTLEIMNSVWLKEHAIRAQVDTLRFPDGCAREMPPLSNFEDCLMIFFALQIFGVFVYIPVALSILWAYLPPIYVGIIAAVFVVISHYGPWTSYPAAFRRDWLFEIITRYYSYRMIVESPLSAYQRKTAIYTFGPHGVFGIAPAAQSILHEMVTGDNFHMLGVSAIFKVPVYNAICRMLSMKSIDRKTFKKTLLSGKSVGLLPGGIAEMFATNAENETLVNKDRKGFVALALETGSQIVPCYNFGNSQTFSIPNIHKSGIMETLSRKLRTSLILFYGRWGLPIPYRTPLLTVVGRPILCPKVENPSPELINDYHQRYLRETRRVYDTYKNTYNWEKRPLLFKR